MSMNMKILENSFHKPAHYGLGFAEKLHLILEDFLLIINSFKYLSSVSTCQGSQSHRVFGLEV